MLRKSPHPCAARPPLQHPGLLWLGVCVGPLSDPGSSADVLETARYPYARGPLHYPCISDLGSSWGERFPASLLWMQFFFSSMSIQNLPFHQNSPLRATVEAVPWRPLRSIRTSLCVWTQKTHLAPARFASECEVRCFASAMPVRSMHPRAGSEHEHSIADSVSAHQPKSMSAATHRQPM